MPGCETHERLCDGDNASDPSCGKCEYRLLYDTAKCSLDRPCDNLMILFSAWDCMGDKVGEALASVAAHADGFVAACVQPLYPGEILPSTLGAPLRDDETLGAVMTELTTSRGVWTGKNLLFGGCSAGGSRYPSVAARFAPADRWVGTAKTAVCMSDGVVAVPYQDDFIAAGTGPSCAGRHARIASAYTGANPTSGHSCTGSPDGHCACDPAHTSRSFPASCGGGDCVAFDSIVTQDGAGTWTFSPGISARSFAATQWKLISEGSGFGPEARCEKDIVPEDPYRALCTLIDADPDRTCTFESHPDAQHCGYFTSNLVATCVDWFAAL